MKRFSWVVSFLAVTVAALFAGCSDPISLDDFVYRCDPAGNDCAAGAACIRAGNIRVCSENTLCVPECTGGSGCVNGECRCFASCDGRECGDDGCGGSCGGCQDRLEWCNSGICEMDDCGTKECGTGAHGAVCGTCLNGFWCNSGTCEKDDCGTKVCGTGAHGGVCGTCQNGWWCDSGACKEDDCGTRECGAGTHGAVCGNCGSGEMCNSLGACIPGKMLLIPGGSFLMGSDCWADDEQPVHTVKVNPFEMSETEVSVSQYRLCVNAAKCSEPGFAIGCNWGVLGNEDQPVNCVDWNQAAAYAAWAGGRLPTEAEWEYAARGGTTGDLYGDINDIAWYEGNSAGLTHAVGKLDSNSFGLYDMLGNVHEWCQDWYHDSYVGAPSDGRAWLSPAGSSRVLRGGSWLSEADDVLVSLRGDYYPGYHHSCLGFRIARSVP